MQGLELSFPAPSRPLSINEANGMHWAAKLRRLQPWKEAAQIAWMAAKRQQHLVKNKPCTVEVHLPFPDERRRDPHNYSSTVQKTLIDALVHDYQKVNGETMLIAEWCWPDDNPQWVKTLEPVLYKGTECKIRITPHG